MSNKVLQLAKEVRDQIDGSTPEDLVVFLADLISMHKQFETKGKLELYYQIFRLAAGAMAAKTITGKW